MLKRIARRLATLIAVALVAGMVSTGTSIAAQEIHEASGTIRGANPTSDNLISITQAEFLESCPALPASQGLDAWVFAIPEPFRQGSAASITGANDFGEWDLDGYFYKADCSPAGSLATPEVNEAGPLPADAAFGVVVAWLGVNTTATLKLTKGDPEPVPLPSTGPPGPQGPGGTQTTFSTSANSVEHGLQVAFSGTAIGSGTCFRVPEVVVERQAEGTTEWTEVTSAEPDADGNWTASAAPDHNAIYRARAPESGRCLPSEAANLERIGVRSNVEITKVSPCRSFRLIDGSVSPNKEGYKVVLQRKTRAGWKQADWNWIDADSTFWLQDKSCRGRLRVVVPRQVFPDEPVNDRGSATVSSK